MGDIAKIPYLREVVIYFIKVFLCFFVFREIFNYFNAFNPQILIILSLFLGFSMGIHYLIFFLMNYLIFFSIARNIESEFILLFIYLANTLINTFIIMLYIKYNVVNKDNKK